MKLKPPNNTATFNGAKIGSEGVEVSDADGEALIARGWIKTSAAASKPQPKKQKPQPAAAEETSED